MDHDDVVSKVVTMLRKTQNGLGGEAVRVAFSVCIDATSVAQNCQISSRYKAIVLGANLHHFISIEGKSKEQVKKLIGSVVQGDCFVVLGGVVPH